MIKKLRIKFVVINMTLVMCSLCTIFGLIYYFTQHNLETESIGMMKSIANKPFQLGQPDEIPEDIRLPFLTIQVGLNGEMVSLGGGYYDLSDEQFLNKLVDETMQSKKQSGVIKEYRLRYYRLDVPMGTFLVFSDMSSEIHTLNQMLQTFGIISLFSFFIFLGISVYLACWATKPVEAAWKQQKQFVADASHELKTPLTVIRTNCMLLQDEKNDEKTQHQLICGISYMSKQMQLLLEKMLILAKSDANENRMVMKTLDLSRLVMDGVVSFEGVFVEKGLALESKIEQEIMIQGNAEALRHLLEILLDNAQKYSNISGTTNVRLYRKAKNRICLCVSNPGEPMSNDVLKKIFQRFYRQDEARTRDGSFGLGLSIAQEIAKKHHAKIWAESESGENRFYVEFYK